MECLKLNLMGRFSLSTGSNVLNEEKLRSNRMIQILSYLLIYRKNVISHQELIRVFWEDDKKKNPETALRNQIYRLRSELKALGESKYICTLAEAYQWNPEILVETDYEEYERLAARLQEMARGGVKSDSDNERKRLCRELIDRYCGNITPKLAGESWLLAKTVRYQADYLEAIKQLCGIYEQEEDWEKLERLCSHGMEENPLEEDFYCWMMEALHGMKKYTGVTDCYEKAARVFGESIGISHPEKLQRTFEQLIPDARRIVRISEVLRDVKDNASMSEAFVCSYPMFCRIYHLDIRRMPRLKISQYVLLITLLRTGKAGKKAPADQKLSGEMEVLEDVLRKNLRAGDVVARYGQNQFIILLSLCSQEGCVVVFERIRKAFREQIGSRHLELKFELNAVEKHMG